MLSFLPAAFSVVGAFFNLKVALIIILFVVGIPAIFLAGYMWWSRRL